MGTIRGLDCELFYNSGTYASPTWAAVDAVRDANYEISMNEVDASRRGSGGWRQNETTLRDATLNVTFVKDKDDTSFVAIESAAQAGTAVELVAYDGANAVGSDGLDAKWKCTSWTETQDLEGIVVIEAVFRPTPDADITPNFLSGALPTTRP
jgi:hypothetical protein